MSARNYCKETSGLVSVLYKRAFHKGRHNFRVGEEVRKIRTLNNLIFNKKNIGDVPSAIDSDSLEPLSVLHSKSKFEW